MSAAPGFSPSFNSELLRFCSSLYTVQFLSASPFSKRTVEPSTNLTFSLGPPKRSSSENSEPVQQSLPFFSRQPLPREEIAKGEIGWCCSRNAGRIRGAVFPVKSYTTIHEFCLDVEKLRHRVVAAHRPRRKISMFGCEFYDTRRRNDRI